MNRVILLAFSLATLGSISSASTIVVQTGNPAVDVKLSNGSFLTSGSVVLGYIRNYTDSMNSSLADQNKSVITFLQNNFIPIGTANSDVDYGTPAQDNAPRLVPINASSNSVSGTIENSNWLTASGGSPANSQQASGLVRGTRIFMLIFNSSTLDSATELGIFSASNWTLPTSSVVNALNMTLTQVDAPAEVYRGSIGSLQLATVVPEPAVASFALAALGLALRRRRR